MNATVPTVIPGVVRPLVTVAADSASVRDSAAWRIFARPKSMILTSPADVTNTFAGLMSRWITLRACAAARPSAI